MKFIVDFMLGRLARWLRLLGYDTLYSREKEDIVYTSLKESRVVLTRNRNLSRRKSYKLMIIKSDDFREQVKQVIRDLNLPVDDTAIFSRCVHCNEEVERVNKNLIKDKVPPFVYESHDDFSLCPSCQRIYWKGSHWDLLKKDLEAMRG